MILLVIEVVLFFAGLVGLLIALPLPVAFMAGLVLALGPETGRGLGSLIELVTLVVALIAARVLSHRFHKAALNTSLVQQ